MVTITGVTHWSIGVRDLEESERFYKDLLGLEYLGRLGNSRMACFKVGNHNILLCETASAKPSAADEPGRVHHAFETSSDDWTAAVRLLRKQGVTIAGPIVYRERGFFPGREIYFLDPTGNILELRDASWQPGMPTPTFEEITAEGAVV
jgi:catechol 2,3-dioxygenase-like lactoylglutathione lyase family enzyme